MHNFSLFAVKLGRCKINNILTTNVRSVQHARIGKQV